MNQFPTTKHCFLIVETTLGNFYLAGLALVYLGLLNIQVWCQFFSDYFSACKLLWHPLSQLEIKCKVNEFVCCWEFGSLGWSCTNITLTITCIVTTHCGVCIVCYATKE